MPDPSNPPARRAAMAAARRRLKHLKLTAAAASVLALGGLTQAVAAQAGAAQAGPPPPVTGATPPTPPPPPTPRTPSPAPPHPPPPPPPPPPTTPPPAPPRPHPLAAGHPARGPRPVVIGGPLSTVVALTQTPSPLWYFARASGFVSLILLTATVAVGLALAMRWRSARWPLFLSDGLHRYLGTVLFVFLAVHVLTLWLDPFAKFSLADVLIPFRSSYRTLWMGLGICAAELGLAP